MGFGLICGIDCDVLLENLHCLPIFETRIWLNIQQQELKSLIQLCA